MAKNRGRGNPSLLQLLFDCGKTSKKPVFDQFLLFLSTSTFQSIVHYAKRLDVVGEKVRAICTAELLKVPADCHFSTPLQNALQTPSNKYTDINNFTIKKTCSKYICVWTIQVHRYKPVLFLHSTDEPSSTSDLNILSFRL